MIAGLISPAVESPGQESDNDSLPGKGSYTSSHASSDDEQPGILLLDDSTSIIVLACHIIDDRRQASHPGDARSTHSDPTAEDLGIALSLVVAPCERLRCGPLKSVEFIQRSWHARQENDSGVAQLPRSPSLLEMAAQNTIWARPSVNSDYGGKCIPHSHGPDRAADPANWRTSCLSASLMRDASRKDADACSNEALRVSSQLQLASAVD